MMLVGDIYTQTICETITSICDNICCLQVISGHSLVLQGVGRRSAGNYRCTQYTAHLSCNSHHHHIYSDNLLHFSCTPPALLSLLLQLCSFQLRGWRRQWTSTAQGGLSPQTPFLAMLTLFLIQPIYRNVWSRMKEVDGKVDLLFKLTWNPDLHNIEPVVEVRNSSQCLFL